MSPERVLVTGGAGFIGSHLVDRLLERGHAVVILDALLPQVHPGGVPSYLNRDAELRIGDVRDPDAMRSALHRVTAVAHLAAAVGVGQSMYEPRHYCDVNVLGTATLLEALAASGARPSRVVVASSMSVYGEGRALCARCGPQDPPPRPLAQLAGRDWILHCPSCGAPLEPVASPEDKPTRPMSIYAMTKRDQEEMVMAGGRALDIPPVALRFFNVYGERQALSNPYTGVAGIFSSALLHRRRPVVFEDGRQRRDFVHVSDVVEACVLAIEETDARDEVFNIGTGRAVGLLELFEVLRAAMPAGRDVEPEILAEFREGDIRACHADISRARERLGFLPRVTIEEGVPALADWAASQTSPDRSPQALAELRQHGLVR